MTRARHASANPRYRTVDLTELDTFLQAVRSGNGTDDAERLIQTYPKVLANVRRQANLRPVPVNGSRALGRRLGYFQCVLRDGTVGYFQRRADDCVQAAIATLVQIPMPDVPDLRLDKHAQDGHSITEIETAVTEQYTAWTRQHGLTIKQHAGPLTSAKRWIGVCAGDTGKVSDHCLVMSGDECVWDPTRTLPPTKHEPIIQTRLDVRDIYYSLTIERTI